MKPDITVDEKVKELVRQNKVPQAVKLVMDHYKFGLKQAKDYVDKLTVRIKN
jgi:ribosomal protein L7/L12